MRGAAWPQTVDPAPRPPAIGPRAAILTQDCTGEEGIAVLDEVVRCAFLGGYGGDVLVGDFAEDFGYEGHLCLGCVVVVRAKHYLKGVSHVNSPACVRVPEAPDAFGPGAGLVLGPDAVILEEH